MSVHRVSVCLLTALTALVLACPGPATASPRVGVSAGEPAAPLPASLLAGAVAHDALRIPATGTVVLADERIGGLPETYCRTGAPTAADETLGAAYGPSMPQFKLVYAYPTDVGNRFDTVKDRLQADVSLIDRFVAGQANGAKTVRFDMGTDCGSQYVDIAAVPLSGPAATYRSTTTSRSPRPSLSSSSTTRSRSGCWRRSAAPPSSSYARHSRESIAPVAICATLPAPITRSRASSPRASRSLRWRCRRVSGFERRWLGLGVTAGAAVSTYGCRCPRSRSQ